MARISVDPSSFSPAFQHCTNLTELTILDTYHKGQQKLELPLFVTRLLCDAEFFTSTRRPFVPEHDRFRNITHLHLLTNVTKQELWIWIGQEFFPSLSHLAVVHREDGDLCSAAQDCADFLKNLPDQVQVCALVFVPSSNLVSVMDQNTIDLSDGTVDPRAVIITSTPKVLAAPLGYVMTFVPTNPTAVWLESSEKEIFEAAQHTINTRKINGRFSKGYYSFHSPDSEGRTALSRASEKGYLDVVQFLLARDDVEADSPDWNGRTPLSWACENGYPEIVKLFLGRDVEVNFQDKRGRTPLSWACVQGHLNVAQLLLAGGYVKIDCRDSGGQTAISLASENGHLDILQFLLAQKGADADSRDRRNRSPLSWACGKGHSAVVNLFLARGDVEVNSRDMMKQTPLSWACEEGYFNIAQALIGAMPFLFTCH
ncbi:ankyrin repeat-containing domain protein [Flagelloscypha sp. PMI_526]|nr:ankyrin repeat-containing domain protein [Flagelloscypha sp. PMI_526]